MFVFKESIYRDDWKEIAKFSSHWAACAAMIRISNPDFKSLGGDKNEDLEIEKNMVAA